MVSLYFRLFSKVEIVFENFKGENMRWYFILFYFLQHVLALSQGKLLFSFPLLHTFLSEVHSHKSVLS